MGIRVGNNKGNPTGLKNEGTITIESGAGENIGIFSETSVINNDGTIEVKGDKNIGMLLKETKSDTNDTSGNKKKITIDGTNGFGVMLVNNDNKAEFINYTGAEIKATGENSMGMYTKDSVVKNENGELKGKIIVKNKAYNATIKKEKEYEMLNIGIQMTEANGTRYEAIINDIFAKESAKKNKNKLLSTLYDLKSERKKWPNNQFESLDNIYYINDKIKSICTYKNNKTSCDVVLLKTNKKLKLKQIFKDMNDPHLKAILATAGVSENFVLSPLGLTFLNEEQISVPLDELRPYFSEDIGL